MGVVREHVFGTVRVLSQFFFCGRKKGCKDEF